MKSVFVVECPHHDIFSSHRERRIADLLCKGCCNDAVVTEYFESHYPKTIYARIIDDVMLEYELCDINDGHPCNTCQHVLWALEKVKRKSGMKSVSQTSR